MFFVIGQEKYRKQWISEHDLPFFEFEEMQDENTLAMWNSEIVDAAALIIELVPSGQESYNSVYNVALFDDKTNGYYYIESYNKVSCFYNKARYTTYEDAYQAYSQINLKACPFCTYE